MKKNFLALLVIFLSISGCAQNEQRLKIVSITPSENTGQDYAPWLTDDLNQLVPNDWNNDNFQYVDVTLKLGNESKITRLALYDFEGIFTDNPATIYALNGSQKTLLGTFTGELYKTFVNIIPGSPVIADAIIIHKYANNIPEKVEVFGTSYNEISTADSLPHALITFNNIPDKTVGDSFNITAESNNTSTPINFISSDPAILKVNMVNNKWIATAANAGSATITASQAAGNNFLAAITISKTIAVHNKGTVTINNIKIPIPIDPERWFQLTNASNGLEGLFDGNIQTPVTTGWGKILDNYDSYYPVLNGEEIDLSSIKLYDGKGSNTTQPLTIFVITDKGQKINVGTFTGSQYNTWVGPNPNYPTQFKLQTTFKNIRYIVFNSWNFFPTEIEFYGNYTPGKTVDAVIKKSFPLKNMFGVNGFEWNFESPASPGQVESAAMRVAKTFTGFRHYMDWGKLELTQGSYSFNPTLSGGWNYDALYDSCQAAGIEVLACLKTLPPWMLDTYPSDLRDAENVPVKFGQDFTDPNSYIEQARVAFQYAARYGSNKNVNRNLLSVNNVPRWNGDFANTIKVGLGTVHYIECDNERDKWWKGRKAYQTAYEYAANLSAFYDGNKNTMGPGVGIKNADPQIKVVMAGTALASADYLKGMADWCRQHRGYNSDGTVNLCWDIINYHLYSNDSKTSQNGNATRGAAPEVSGTADVAASFIKASHLYANDMPVWVTELGYDINQGSAFKAIAIGDKSALQTQADWILRSSLLYARTGVARIFFYEMYDDNANNALQFSSSGLLNADKTRKPAADYIYQANQLFGNYIYQETINSDPIVDHYKLNNSNAYVIVVPDEKGRTASYTLDLGNASSAKIYTPKIGSDSMSCKIVFTTNGKLNITATETPLFVIPDDKYLAELSDEITQQNIIFANDIKIYPNPSSGMVHVIINNNNYNNVTIKIYEAASGKLLKELMYKKTGNKFSQSININSLVTGYYMLEVRQGEKKMIRKILKATK